jgi:hypothetical protein
MNGFGESLNAAAQSLGLKATINVDEQDCQTKDGLPLTATDITVG